MYCAFTNTRIAAITACVPANEIRLEDEAQYYGGLKKVERLKKAIGVNRRRICPDGVTAADLCQQAAENLFAMTGIDRSGIDALLFLSQTPDYQMPATACILQNRLGLAEACAAMDLSQGCSGYIYGLWIASSLVSSGACRNVLLLVGDALPTVNLKNRVIAPIFGHGGSATLVSRENGAGEILFELGSDGSGFEHIIKPAGGARLPISLTPEPDAVYYREVEDGAGNPWQMAQTFMDGRAIFDFTMRVVPGHLQKFMASAHLEPGDINYLFLHQANRQIVEMVASKAGFDPQMADCSSFGAYGNLACASIPVSICHRLGAQQPDCGLMLLSGFGIGLSWGSCLAPMGGLQIGAVSTYQPQPGHMGREERINYWLQKFSAANKEQK